MTQPLLVVVPTHVGDVEQAEKQMRWMVELGNAKEHSLLVAADGGVPVAQVKALLDVGRGTFHSVRAMIVNTGAKGWPLAANLMFRAVARQIQHAYKMAWLWLEPDAVPLRASWLNDIAEAYRRCPKQFMGHVIDNEKPAPGLPDRYLSGIAVYPQNTFGLLANRWQDAKFTGPVGPKRPTNGQAQAVGAWDMTFADEIVPRAEHTALIHSHWGTSYANGPVFKGARTEADPPNVVTPDFIKPGAVLFHRVKDIDGFLTLWRVRLEYLKALVVEVAHRETGEASRDLDVAMGPATAVEMPADLPTLPEPAPVTDAPTAPALVGDANRNFKGGESTLQERRRAAALRSKQYQEESKRKAQQLAESKRGEPARV